MERRSGLRAPALAILFGAILGGCGSPSRESGDDPLAGACQFEPCVCADADAPVWQEPETAPIIWSRTSGAPACPLGYVLQRSDEN